MASRKTRIDRRGRRRLVLAGDRRPSTSPATAARRIAVQTQKAGAARPDLDRLGLGRGQAEALRQHRRQRLGPHHQALRQGGRPRAGRARCWPGSTRTRFAADERQSEAAVQAARADLDRSQRRPRGRRGSPSSAPRRCTHEKLVSDQAFDQAEAELRDEARPTVDSLKEPHRPARRPPSSPPRQPREDHVVVAHGRRRDEPRQGRGRGRDRGPELQPTVIMTVADLSVMEAEVLVDETDIRNVALGQAAEVRVDALEGLEIKGEVTEIGSSAIPRGATATRQRPRPPTPATRPRTSRSRSRSRTRPPRSARV